MNVRSNSCKFINNSRVAEKSKKNQSKHKTERIMIIYTRLKKFSEAKTLQMTEIQGIIQYIDT